MGVRGLSTFLRENESRLARKSALANTKLIIDANPIFYAIYEDICCAGESSPYFRNDVYGGDLVYFGQVVRTIFENFKQCSIEPILVFDGSAVGKMSMGELVSVKEAALVEKYTKQFEELGRASDSDQRHAIDNITYYPRKNQLLGMVFRNITQDLNVERVVAAYENDDRLIDLANKFGCPILSNDTNLLIHSRNQGLLFLDKKNFKSFLEVVDNKIHCSIYHSSSLREFFPRLNLNTLPIMYALLSYGYSVNTVFDDISFKLKLGIKRSSGRLVVNSRSQHRIVNLLRWLEGKDLYYAILGIISGLNAAKRQYVENAIRLLVDRFNGTPKIWDLKTVIHTKYPPKPSPESNTETGESSATSFIVDLLENDCLTGACLKIMFRQTQYEYRVIDDRTLPSANILTERPFSLTLALLKPDKRFKDDSYYSFFDRRNGGFQKVIIKPMEELSGFGSLKEMTCYSLPGLDIDKRKTMLLTCFHMNEKEFDDLRGRMSNIFKGDFVGEATLCILLVVRYIQVETKTKARREFVQALLLTLFYHAILAHQINTTTFGSDQVVEMKQEAFKDTIKPHVTMKSGTDHKPVSQSTYRRIMHYIFQLQMTYKAYNLLDCLMQHPLHKPRHDRFFNCTLIFKLTNMFIGKDDNDEVASFDNLCQDFPGIIDIMEFLEKM